MYSRLTSQWDSVVTCESFGVVQEFTIKHLNQMYTGYVEEHQ